MKRKSEVGLMLLSLSVGFVMAGMLVGNAAVAQPPSAAPLHVVRVGFGKVAAIKENITAAVQGCQVIKHLAPSDVALPADSYLAGLAISEEDEYFDGQLWAIYKTERSLGADAARNCRLTMFTHRSADVERTCESRIRGNTTLMGEMKDLTDPQESVATIDDDVLSSSACKRVARSMDLSGLPRFNAGAAQCVWSSVYLAKKMAKFGASVSADGFDTCLYEAQPEYSYQGYSRPVVLATRVVDSTGQNDKLSSIFGEAQAFGDQSLKEFAVGKAIDEAVFTRAKVQSFLALPAKTDPGGR